MKTIFLSFWLKPKSIHTNECNLAMFLINSYFRKQFCTFCQILGIQEFLQTMIGSVYWKDRLRVNSFSFGKKRKKFAKFEQCCPLSTIALLKITQKKQIFIYWHRRQNLKFLFIFFLCWPLKPILSLVPVIFYVHVWLFCFMISIYRFLSHFP